MLQMAASDHVCPAAQNQQRRTRCRDQVADPGLIYAVTGDEVGFAGPALSADIAAVRRPDQFDKYMCVSEHRVAEPPHTV